MCKEREPIKSDAGNEKKREKKSCMATLSCETTAYILWTTSLSIVYTALLDISESGITIDTRHTKCNANGTFYKISFKTPG